MVEQEEAAANRLHYKRNILNRIDFRDRGMRRHKGGELEVELRKSLRHLAFWLAVVAAAPAVNASTGEYVTLSRLVEDSSVAVIGTVTGTSYETVPESGSPVTVIRLQRMTPILGQQHLEPFIEDGLDLWFSGGLTTDGSFEIRATMPRLQLGGTYLLFLRGGKWTVNPITGWDRGAFLVMPDGVSGARVLLAMNGEILMGLQDDRIVTAPLPGLNGTPDSSPPDPASAKIRPLDEAERAAMLRALAGSIYREETAAQSDRPESEEADSVLEDLPQMFDGYGLKSLHVQLGGEPIHLEAFISLIHEVDRKIGRDRRRPPFRPRPGAPD